MRRLFKNGRFYTLRGSDSLHANFDESFNSLLVQDNLIVEVGNNIDPSLADVVIDLDGAVCVPSFTDAHVHLFQTGFLLDGADFSDVSGEEELLDRIASQVKDRRFFQSWGYDPSKITGDAELPTKTMLDRIDSKTPMFIRRIDGHSSALNTAAIELLCANIEGFTKPDEKGHIYNQVHLEAERFFLSLAEEDELASAVKAVEAQALSVGATSIHGLVHRIDWAEAIPETKIDIEPYLESWNPLDALGLNLKRIGGCLLLDGSFGSHTAALSFPYIDRAGYCGKLYKSDDELYTFMELARESNLQTAFHAIGDLSAKQILNIHKCFSDEEFRTLRHRIEHAELLFDDDIKMIKELGLVLSMQPAFELYWGGADKMYGRRLGTMTACTNRYRSILEAGIMIAGGSDAYITPIHPLLGVHAAVNHPNPNEAITVGAALRMFSYGGPYAIGQEKSKGSLEVGKEASFAVLSDDPFKIDKSRLRDILVKRTVLRGETVYIKGEADV